jgi:hypothetical protein
MRDGANAPSCAHLERDDVVVIVCPWRHAGFFWTQVLSRRRLHYDREYGDLERLRDALARGRGDVVAGASDADHEATEWRDRAPLTLRLPRGVAVIVAEYLTAAQALPDVAEGYDPESPSLYPAPLVDLAHEIGADWKRQLYLEPNAV